MIIKTLIKFFYKNAFIRIGNSIPVSRDLEKFLQLQSENIAPFIKINKKNFKKRIKSK